MSYIDVKLEKTKIMEHINNTFTVPCEKFKIVSFASSATKNIVKHSAWSRFPVKSIYCIAFWSGSSACCYVKSIAFIL